MASVRKSRGLKPRGKVVMPYKDREKQKEYLKAYEKTRKSRDRSDYHKSYRAANPEKMKHFQKNRIQKDNRTHRDRKHYSIINKDRIKAYKKIYRLKNKTQIADCRRKRKALKLGNRHEPYESSYIFERDGWICGICGTKINRRLKYPHYRSKSIDHIIPLSKGGADAPENVQAAHLRCNLSKNAGGGGQLRLMG